MRSRAASRLRSCDRCSDATTVSTPSTRRRSSRSRARARKLGSSALVVVMSRLSSTRESAVFTDCPPGPGDRLKRHRSSRSGTTTESVTRIAGHRVELVGGLSWLAPLVPILLLAYIALGRERRQSG